MPNQADVELRVMPTLSADRVRTDESPEYLLVICMNENTRLGPAGLGLNDRHREHPPSVVAQIAWVQNRHADRSLPTRHSRFSKRKQRAIANGLKRSVLDLTPGIWGERPQRRKRTTIPLDSCAERSSELSHRPPPSESRVQRSSACEPRSRSGARSTATIRSRDSSTTWK